MYLLANPFISSYVHSDGFGKGIFFALFVISVLSWTLLIQKTLLLQRVRKVSNRFQELFDEKDPLEMQLSKESSFLRSNPYFEIYKIFKQKVLQIVTRNHQFASSERGSFSEADFGLVESAIQTAALKELRKLEKHLFILSTIATLGPFLGLLGTVWGILMTFSDLSVHAAHHSAMLSGLSMALATTVIGLIVAIPALVGFNYLKNTLREYQKEVENFAQSLIYSLELSSYRFKDVKTQSSISY